MVKPSDIDLFVWHINSGGKKLDWLNTKKFSGKSSELIEQNDDDDADIKAPDSARETAHVLLFYDWRNDPSHKKPLTPYHHHIEILLNYHTKHQPSGAGGIRSVACNYHTKYLSKACHGKETRYYREGFKNLKKYIKAFCPAYTTLPLFEVWTFLNLDPLFYP